jgi:hypothetical protein
MCTTAILTVDCRVEGQGKRIEHFGLQISITACQDYCKTICMCRKKSLHIDSGPHSTLEHSLPQIIFKRSLNLYYTDGLGIVVLHVMVPFPFAF